MSNDPAQWEIVLRELRIAGPRGVHTFELRRMFIGNPSQRIAELAQRGYEVTSTREKLNGKATGTRYVLVSGPNTPAVKPPGEYVDRDPSLWGHATPRRLAIFDDEDWAA